MQYRCLPRSQVQFDEQHGAANGRPVAWSFGPWPTSSPASSTPRTAASGLDLGHQPKEGHPCRRRLAVSLVPGGRLPDCVVGPGSPLAVTSVVGAEAGCVLFLCLRGRVQFSSLNSMTIAVSDYSRLVPIFLCKTAKKSAVGIRSPRSYASYVLAETPRSVANATLPKLGRSMRSPYVLRALARRSARSVKSFGPNTCDSLPGLNVHRSMPGSIMAVI